MVRDAALNLIWYAAQNGKAWKRAWSKIPDLNGWGVFMAYAFGIMQKLLISQIKFRVESFATKGSKTRRLQHYSIEYLKG